MAEEYDSAHESRGDSDTDAAMEDGEGSDSGAEQDNARSVERPKKKAKTEH